jgi:hypothetical protein
MQLADLESPEKATKALEEACRAFEPSRFYLGRTVSVNRCMFTGKHWITEEMLYKYDTLGRHLVNLNPDTPKLRITLNRIPRFIHETAAATFPEMLEFRVTPPERDVGPEASLRASAQEDALAVAVDKTGFLDVARDANYRRCIDGVYGIGINVNFEGRKIGEAVEDDCIVKAFEFDAHQLTLDPENNNLDLWNHEYVIFRDVWTASKIRRVYGVDLDESKLKSCGELMPIEMMAHTLSQNRLYSWLATYSETKGAIVYQVHLKDESGRFGRMLVGVDDGTFKTTWLNIDNQESPYGGCGMPFMLLHGYREPDVWISQSDVSLLKNDQDQINLLRTMFARIHQKHAGFQWMVAKGSMIGDGPDDFRSQFRNYVGGVIEFDPGNRDNPKPAPQLVQYPAPHPYLQDVISVHQERDMPAQVHRNPITGGATKSHVPDSTFQSALQAASQVLGNRLLEDKRRYEKFSEMLLGTYVKLVHKGSPSVLSQLRRDGFDATDFAMIHETDPYYPACGIKLTDRSIRYRSIEQKEQSLNEAAQLQMISPEDYRLGRAALDSPITEDDRFYASQADKWAMRVLLGEEWQPRSLGKATGFFVASFQRATLDRRTEVDPTAIERLNNAIMSMMAMQNAEMAAQAEAQQPQQAQQAAQPQQAEMPQEVDLAALITSLSGGGGQMAQPAAA